MPIIWFSSSVPKEEDYLLKKSTIIITNAGLNKLPSGAKTVRLGYDAEKNVIGLAAAEPGDKTAFKIARRGRGTQLQVSAKKFFDRFGIQALPESVGGTFEENDGITFISLRGGNGAHSPVRRRRSKSEMAASRGAEAASAQANSAGDAQSAEMQTAA